MARWKIDTSHSDAVFAVRHMMLAKVHGTFHGISGVIDYDPDRPEEAGVEAAIDASTVHTGIPDRDDHLRSPDFLDVSSHPRMVFSSRRLTLGRKGKAPWATLAGDLTIRGVPRPVILRVENLGERMNPFKHCACLGFSATAIIDRAEFGMVWNAPMEDGGVMVGREVEITLEIEALPE